MRAQGGKGVRRDAAALRRVGGDDADMGAQFQHAQAVVQRAPVEGKVAPIVAAELVPPVRLVPERHPPNIAVALVDEPAIQNRRDTRCKPIFRIGRFLVRPDPVAIVPVACQNVHA